MRQNCATRECFTNEYEIPITTSPINVTVTYEVFNTFSFLGRSIDCSSPSKTSRGRILQKRQYFSRRVVAITFVPCWPPLLKASPGNCPLSQYWSTTGLPVALD